MNDGQRIYPVNMLILHHSMGPRFENSSDLEIQDWFSSVGRNRGYAGVDHSYHEHPSRPGVETFAQAQFAGVPDSSNKYNYRIVTLIARPWENVAWHASNWAVNQQSVGIENCGDFTGMLLENRQLMCIADFYRFKDQELGGATTILGHQEVAGASTACPARIMEQRDTLVDMINNPDKWNAILWPPVYIPKITTEITTEETSIPFKKTTIEDNTKTDTKITTIGVNGKRVINYLITYTDGMQTSKDIYSDTTTPAIDEVTTIGTYVPPVVVPPTTPTEPVEENSYIKQLIAKFINWIIKILTGKK